jgi:hypothetical protein
MFANINKVVIVLAEHGEVDFIEHWIARVQNARIGRGVQFHPCKSVGVIEYGLFAKTIDNRSHVQHSAAIRDKRLHCNCLGNLRN